jgi:hypothetical protein
MDAVPFVRAAAAALLAATAIETANVIRIVSHAYAKYDGSAS